MSIGMYAELVKKLVKKLGTAEAHHVPEIFKQAGHRKRQSLHIQNRILLHYDISLINKPFSHIADKRV